LPLESGAIHCRESRPYLSIIGEGAASAKEPFNYA
jgi:hypothetical protein